MTRFLLAASVAAFTLAAGAASAATVTFSNLKANWQNPVGGANVAITSAIPPGPNASIRWGTTTGQQSGYDFAFAADPLSSLIGPTFTLGTFTHLNFPIADNTAITQVELLITADVAIDATPVGTKNFVFIFEHDETKNDLNPCPYGGANGVGVNVNGCADRVKTTTSALTESFFVGSTEYTLTLSGFVMGAVQMTEFLTTENQSNSAFIVARVQEVGIAEPASLALLGAGLLGLGFAARRRV